MAHVRAERADDHAAIRSVHLAAFPTPAEADLVEQLRKDGDAFLSLVAVETDRIVGHVLFSRMSVDADARQLSALALAPVAVIPDRQGRGIGSALVEAGIEQTASKQIDMIFVLGEPAYCGRFGFDAKAAAPFASPYAGPYLQARAINGFVPPLSGRATYSPAFERFE
jgi:putative acetyltransferase